MNFQRSKFGYNSNKNIRTIEMEISTLQDENGVRTDRIKEIDSLILKLNLEKDSLQKYSKTVSAEIYALRDIIAEYNRTHFSLKNNP